MLEMLLWEHLFFRFIKNITQKTLREDFRLELAQLPPSEQQLFLKMIQYMEKKCISILMQIIKNTVDLDLEWRSHNQRFFTTEKTEDTKFGVFDKRSLAAIRLSIFE